MVVVVDYENSQSYTMKYYNPTFLKILGGMTIAIGYKNSQFLVGVRVG